MRLQVINGAPEEIRTPDPRFRKPLLYPTELQAHNGRGSKIRTYDHSLPKRVRYQTALYPEGFSEILQNNFHTIFEKYMSQ